MAAILTKKTLKNFVDLSASLPSTKLRQGDWLVMSSFRLDAGSSATFRYLNINIESSSVNIPIVTADDKISGSLGLVFVGLYKDYDPSSHPSRYSAVATVIANDLGITNNGNSVITLEDPGIYNFVVANNVLGNENIGTVDFSVVVTGQIRINLVK